MVAEVAVTAADLLVVSNCEVERSAMAQSMAVLRDGHKFLDSFSCDAKLLEEAYGRCGDVTAEYAKTFYLGERVPGGR